jgi:cell division protein FtsW (lipid II flippase)
MKNLFQNYIILGVLYVLVKIIFVSLGYLHPGAILHGAIPAILTIFVGFLSMKKAVNNKQNSLLSNMLLILPLLILVITPVFMYFKMGAEKWLINGRLSV